MRHQVQAVQVEMALHQQFMEFHIIGLVVEVVVRNKHHAQVVLADSVVEVVVLHILEPKELVADKH
jgi:hypothetical protein